MEGGGVSNETARGGSRPAAQARISVCIPTVRAASLEPAILSIRAQTFAGWELLVVGQGPDASRLRAATERAAGGDPRVRYLHLATKGLSAARNAALREAAGEIVAFTDDDCEAEPDWLEALDRCFANDVDLVSGTVIAPVIERHFAVCPSVAPGEITFVVDPADGTLPVEFDALGANLAVRRETALRLGGFDEQLGAGAHFPGGEEHDLVHRMAMAGATLRSTPAAVVHHTYGVRSGLREVYRYRRRRLRGDGAGAAKRAMLAVPEGGLPVGRSVWRAAQGQLETVRLVRLPFAVFRLFDYLTSYRECLQHFALSDAAHRDPALAVLMPRADHGHRGVTAPAAAPAPLAATTC
jgi:GT2 family glycosyltransferase